MAINADTGPDQGTLFAGRYRLQDPLAGTSDDSAREQHWQGFDEVLTRRVMITVLQASGADADNLLAAAVANGRVAHPGVASVFDAAIVEGMTYVVSEWVEGTNLTEVLREGPMPPAQAAGVVQAAAEAVAAVHAQGLVHGNLHPNNVVLTTDGSVKLTDLRTNGDGERAADVCCLGGLLYASLTGKWPTGIVGDAVAGLPDAPYDDDRLCAPRQVRAGVPGYLSDLAMRAMGPDSGLTAIHLAQSLDHHATDPVTGPLPVVEDLADEPPRGSMRRIVLPAVALVVIAMAGLVLGAQLGAVPNLEGYRPFDFGTDAKPTPSPTPAVAQPLAISGVKIIDPRGDGTELDGAELATDGNPATAWRTDDYKRAPFGGLKKGMGVRLDLGAAKGVRQVTVTVQDVGGTVELRAGDKDSPSPDDYRTVTSLNPTSATYTFTITPTTSRYLLIWYTSLPQNDRGFGVGVAEVRIN